MQNIRKQQFRLAAAIWLAVMLIAVPLFTDLSYAPKGWELPKVHAIQIAGLAFLACVTPVTLWLLVKKQISWTSFDTSMVLVGMLISLSSLLSRVSYALPARQMFNPLYKLLLSPEEGSYQMQMAIFGNEYRETGLITVLILFGIGWFAARAFRWREIKIVLLSLIIAAAIQSLLGIFQLLGNLDQTVRLTEGRLVYGSFGQNNFYAGMLLVGIAASFLFFKSEYLIVRISVLVSALLSMVTVFLSFSYFSWIVLIYLLIIAVFASGKLQGAFAGNTSRLVLVTILGAFPAGYLLLSFAPYYAHRINIWGGIITEYVVALVRDFRIDQLLMTLLGSGFDTLQEVLYEVPILDKANVDRAHNIVFTILAMTGVVGLGMVGYFMYKVRTWFIRIDSMQLRLLIIVAGIWLLRSLIHTSSVYNLLQGVILAAAVIAAARHVQLSDTIVGEVNPK